MTATHLRALFVRLRKRFEAAEDRLAELDAKIGDGDHGAAMVRGLRAAEAAVARAGSHDERAAPAAGADEGGSVDDAGEVLVTAAKAFMGATGGASGPLFSSVFLETGRAARRREALDAPTVRDGLEAAVRLVARMGRTEPGDKTLLDALAPAAEAAASAATDGADVVVALQRAAEAAAAGRDATRAMPARRGRAHWIEGEGLGSIDPGATSMALLFEAWAEVAREAKADDGRAAAPMSGRSPENGMPADAGPAASPRPERAERAEREASARAGVEAARSGPADCDASAPTKATRPKRRPANKLLNDHAAAVDEMLEGYVAAYGDLVARVPGKRIVTRAEPKPDGSVGIAIGNGTGHEPIAMGWVGRGMLDTNALGAIFTAPPPDLIADAIVTADRGAGVILLISQHAGDVINGEMGVELARDAGVDARSLLMYDDVASAPKGREPDRRGAPGTMFVYKVVGARAEEGGAIDELETLGARVRDGTRTLSVAVEPGTSPITGKPMFTLPEGEMFVGMGVHGEPGLTRLRAAPADEVVRVMVEALLEDGEYGQGEEVLVFVNGSGGTTLMELLIVYRALDAILRSRGIGPYRPLVGEYVTTQETKGVSISLCRADDEIKRLWDAPVSVPYFQR